MSGTAMESYYEAIQNGRLPGSVPVTDGVNGGLATMQGDWRHSPKIAAMVLSEDWRDRAKAAALVCRQASEVIDSSESDLHTQS